MRPSHTLPPFVLLASVTLGVQAMGELPEDLTALSLEALLDIEVTSVSKRPQGLSEVPAAVYVLSAEEIENSGARTIPEALRLVPGLHVARVDGQRWAITARGFNGVVADKMEVLIDGRSVYSPLFSGVFWDSQDVFMPDLERIEVIRGPAAALWGSNAVNGVINIVTRTAADSQGPTAYVGGGIEQEGFAGLRYGGRAGATGYWRAYAQAWQRDGQMRMDGSDAHDAIERVQGGFRADWERGRDRYTLQGDAYAGEFEFDDPNLNPDGRDNHQDGHNLLARWQRLFGPQSQLSLQLYWDHTERVQQGSFGEERDTYDIELKHSFAWGQRHTLVWGAGYRVSRDEQANPPLILFTPAEREVRSANFFVNDEIRLREDTALTLSARIEDNEFTGIDTQPSVRLSHTFSERTMAWAAWSQALRLPNRLDNDVLVPIPEFGARGNPDFESEEVRVHELGLRHALSRELSMEASAYYNDYAELRGVEPAAPPEIPLIVNNYEGEARGAELTLRWLATPSLTLHAAYAWFDLDLEPQGNSQDVMTELTEDTAPEHLAWLRWDWRPDARWRVGGQLRYVGEVPRYAVDAYTELDLELGLRLAPDWELSLVGQDLLSPSHAEWGEADSQVERAAYLQLSWQPGAR